MATPYVISSDLVSAYPAKSLEIAQYIDGQVPLLAMTQNAQTGTTYSFVAADFTKLVTLSNASPVAVELPLEATVPWSTGTQLRLLNQGAGTVTVAGAVGVTINGTPLTLTQYKGANLIKTGTDTWTFIPFASGVGAAVYSDANTGTYTGYAYKTYTDSGTLTVTQAGLADILLVAGGGPGGSGSFYGAGGGGGGGVLELTGVYLAVGTYTVTIGGGGAAHALQGSPTFLGSFYTVGGGLGGAYDDQGVLGGYTPGINGGSGGGGNTQTNASRNPGAGITGQGFAGGLGVSSTSAGQGSGGGGGASAVGVAGAGSVGGNGGAGKTTTITDASETLGGGGGGYGTTLGSGGAGGGGAAVAGTGVAGNVNTGGGGGGGFTGAATGGAGGSGRVTVRVAV
jgi:hypothetical protein